MESMLETHLAEHLVARLAPPSGGQLGQLLVARPGQRRAASMAQLLVPPLALPLVAPLLVTTMVAASAAER